MKYRYRATFTDGSQFLQPEDDSSTVAPGRTSKMDFLAHCEGRTLYAFVYEGPKVVVLDATKGIFSIDGTWFEPGDKLPPGARWVEGYPEQGTYYRLRQMTFSQADNSTQGEAVEFVCGVRAQPGVRNFLAIE